MDAPDHAWARLAREQGSIKHEAHMILDVEVCRKQSSDVAGSMSCSHVTAVHTRATRAVRVRNGCGWSACHAAAAGDHLERHGGCGRVRRARPSEAPATVFSAVKECVSKRVKYT